MLRLKRMVGDGQVPRTLLQHVPDEDKLRGYGSRDSPQQRLFRRAERMSEQMGDEIDIHQHSPITEIGRLVHGPKGWP